MDKPHISSSLLDWAIECADHFGLDGAHIERLVNFNGVPSHDGIALLATLANHAAKVVSEDFYGLKDMLVLWLFDHHPDTWGWFDDDWQMPVLYCEGWTQTSYHSPGLGHLDWSATYARRNGRSWSGIKNQGNVVMHILDFLGELA